MNIWWAHPPPRCSVNMALHCVLLLKSGCCVAADPYRHPSHQLKLLGWFTFLPGYCILKDWCPTEATGGALNGRPVRAAEDSIKEHVDLLKSNQAGNTSKTQSWAKSEFQSWSRAGSHVGSFQLRHGSFTPDLSDSVKGGRGVNGHWYFSLPLFTSQPVSQEEIIVCFIDTEILGAVHGLHPPEPRSYRVRSQYLSPAGSVVWLWHLAVVTFHTHTPSPHHLNSSTVPPHPSNIFTYFPSCVNKCYWKYKNCEC